MYWYASWEYGVWTVDIWGNRYIQLRAPWNEPLFSERNGYRKPKLKLRGWRLMIEKRGKDVPRT